MSRFGVTLYGTFLDQTWPMGDDEPMEQVTWDNVVKLFFENANPIRIEAERIGHVWDERAIAEVDGKLLEMAQNGRFDGVLSMSAEAIEEVWRRWSYAIIAAEMEKRFGRELNLPIPRDASAEVKGAAVILYVLGGPARDYRREVHAKPAPTLSQQAAAQVRKALASAYSQPPKNPRR